MAGARSVSYEVYYLQYGRWQIHHRYGFSDREAAIEDAKRLDAQGHFDASCVVRESYSESSGTSSESVIYHSPKLKAKPPVGFITVGQDGAAVPSKAAAAPAGGKSRAPLKNAPPGSAAANAAIEARRKAEERQRENAAKKNAPAKEPELRAPPKRGQQGEEGLDWAAMVPKLILAFFAACFVGTVAGIGCFYAVRFAAQMGLQLDGRVNQVIVVSTWFAGWALCFIPMLRRILNAAKLTAAPQEEGLVPQNSAPAPREKVALTLPPEVSKEMEPVPDGPEKPPPMPELDDLEPIGSAEPPANEAKEEPEKKPAEQAPSTSADAKAAFRAEMNGVNDQTQRVAGAAVVSDHFLRFGAILFMAGAADSLSKRHKVDKREMTAVLSDEIKTLGVSDGMALGFAANIDEYLLDDRYNQMYAAGVSAGSTGAIGEAAARAFRAWQTPKVVSEHDKESDPKHYDETTGAEEASHKFVAVLFTDIVNSTQQLTEKGDEWLMNVVRAHNDIVREAIGKHGGREIKHTGDGIMASFPAVASSVLAAMAMQSGVQRFSEAMPALGFELCVGISAGEPIHESGDLFGTPVNLAARVLSKAKPREIAVSNIVHDMSQGKNFLFEELGRFELKGFDEPQPIYKVIDRRAKLRKEGPEPSIAAEAVAASG